MMEHREMHSVKEYPTQDRTGEAPQECPHPSHGWNRQGHCIGAQVDIAQYQGYYATGHRKRRSNRDDKVGGGKHITRMDHKEDNNWDKDMMRSNARRSRSKTHKLSRSCEPILDMENIRYDNTDQGLDEPRPQRMAHDGYA